MATKKGSKKEVPAKKGTRKDAETQGHKVTAKAAASKKSASRRGAEAEGHKVTTRAAASKKSASRRGAEAEGHVTRRGVNHRDVDSGPSIHAR